MSTASSTNTGPTLRAGDEEALLAAAHEVAAELAVGAEQHDREGSFAPENIDAIWRAGLGNLSMPESSGGIGAGLAESAGVVQILAAADASTALIYVMHLVSIRMLPALAADLPGTLVQDVFESSLAGPALTNALRVEPELGSPIRGGVPRTRAVAEVDAEGNSTWRISGHKIFSTGSQGLRWMLVWGATDGPDGEDLVGMFAVPADSPGIEIRETWDHLGMRASASHDVIFRDVVIPADHAFSLAPVGDWGAGPKFAADPATATLGTWLTILLLAVYSGVADAARDWLDKYLHERVPTNLGKPLATLPRMETAMGEIEALLRSSRRLVTTLARESDLGGEAAIAAAGEATIVKVIVTRSLIDAVGLAVSLIGNAGVTRHNPLERHYRDVLCSRIHSPQDDSILLGLGKSVLAAGASR